MPCSTILPVYTWIITFLSMYSFTAKGYTLVLTTNNVPFPIWFLCKKNPSSISCTRCTRSLYSVSVNFLCFSYIFLETYGKSMLCAWAILGYSFPSLLYVLPIWIVTQDGISQCIPLCLATRDQMMPFCFFLKPLLFTKFLLFFHCNDL